MLNVCLLVITSISFVALIATLGHACQYYALPSKVSNQFEGSLGIMSLTTLRGSMYVSEERFTVRIHPDWAPLGAARFREMIDEDVTFWIRLFCLDKRVKFVVSDSFEASLR